jgi:exosortase
MGRVPGSKNRTLMAMGLLTLLVLPCRSLLKVAFADDYYNLYILFIPIISFGMIYADRARIFKACHFCLPFGVLLTVSGIALFALTTQLPKPQAEAFGLSACTFSAIVTGTGCFLLCFGAEAFRRASFALGFSLVTIPIPKPVMNQMILVLQNGSAAFSVILFRLIHVPALRQGLIFSLPGVDIEITQACSGFRSTMAILITSTVVAWLFLRSPWKRLLLVALTVPAVMIKNAARIVTISSLAVYANRGFLYGDLHRYGGLPFALIDLALLVPVIFALHRSDKHNSIQG